MKNSDGLHESSILWHIMGEPGKWDSWIALGLGYIRAATKIGFAIMDCQLFVTAPALKRFIIQDKKSRMRQALALQALPGPFATTGAGSSSLESNLKPPWAKFCEAASAWM